MTRLRTFWPYLPVALAAALQCLCAGLLLTNILFAAVWRNHQIKISPPLHGVTAPEKPRLSPASLASGHYQELYAKLIGSRVPLYPAAVRLRNQAYYSVFGETGNAWMLVGRGKQLLEVAYSDEYCSRDLASFLPKAREWAVQLRQIQDDAERRGQTFLYIVTPSKVAQHPEYLPLGYPCPASDANRAQFVPAWLSIVRQAGIHVVDTIGVLDAARDDYPFALFPRGGTHWNGVGASLATRAVEAALASQRHDDAFPPYTFAWTMTGHPVEPDTDLAELLNLVWPPIDFPVPNDHPTGAAPASCPRLRVVVIGGSFMNQLNARMARSGCMPLVVQYQYWQIIRFAWNGEKGNASPVDPAERARDLATANVLLYEENEQNIARSNHGPALYHFLTQQPGWQPRSPAHGLTAASEAGG